MTQAPPDDDPRPQPPERPEDYACCGQGCSPCIFELYEMARESYESRLRAWEARQAAQKRGPVG